MATDDDLHLPGERNVAGLRCGEVLAQLSEYLDGRLDPLTRASLEAHVKGCSVCERFGGTFGRGIEALRRSLAAEPSDSDVDALLQRTLAGVDEKG